VTIGPHTIAVLFNTPLFLLGFLPLALAGFFLMGRLGGTAWALRWIVAASLVFYGWWDARFVALLAGSIVANYVIGQRILGFARAGRDGAALAAARGRARPRPARLVQIRGLSRPYRCRFGRDARARP
jgi:hypothetical protein